MPWMESGPDSVQASVKSAKSMGESQFTRFFPDESRFPQVSRNHSIRSHFGKAVVG
jgi:hypothetical protein